MWNSWGTTHEFLAFHYLKVRSLEQENVSVVYLFWLKIPTELKKMRLFLDSWHFPVLQWHTFRLSEPECKHCNGWQGEPMVWGWEEKGWIPGMDRKHGQCQGTSLQLTHHKEVFSQSHTLAAAVVLLWCSSDIPTRAEAPSCLGLFVFINGTGSEFGSVTGAEGSSSWEEECAAQGWYGIAQPPHFSAGELLGQLKLACVISPFHV